ncbi:UNVERIFIED_CONTAM: hypothetical protein K2H54_064253, partial [Gekko kuhli]
NTSPPKSATHPVVRLVEERIHRYMENSFSAKWTLKITWVNVQPYPARGGNRGTNTYQAIITTDGYKTFVLFLYQSGGMQWDYTKLTSTNVLIGYTSGDGYFKNDDMIKRTPAEKYRPDRWEGFNTDVQGFWLYEVNSRVWQNYRQMCLDWVDHEDQPSAWNKGLPSCPCSLEEAAADGRFARSRTDSDITMLSSSAPNQHGAGVRCLYGADKQLLEGRQERIWRDVQKTRNDEELKFYDWCCTQAGNQQLCNKYGQKRPKIGCEGQRPPVRGMEKIFDV